MTLLAHHRRLQLWLCLGLECRARERMLPMGEDSSSSFVVGERSVGARSAASVFEERRRIRSVGTPAPSPAVAVSGARADAASEEASSLSFVVGARSATSIF